ncbi:arf-GAP domain and FG repeat-containing protein 1b isoform X2 [Electrophorus electricus]|uniref:arf-GAP domain and FG repeat-containing protein 1b isoform X2 n=1 Tax=Electrophorus electricus TaxID=8005 RepID=UPI0015D0A84A|nr:arf-GAP domain and FG repeat-containing protein 1b isoform X2 [Electrophorus electricus]
MAASAKRKQEEKHLKMLREMTSLPANRKCFDCDQRGPTYANMTVGSFVCTTCSGILRGLNPPHRVKSISMTTFTQQEIEFLQKHSNEVCKHIWLGLYDDRSSAVPDFREPQKVKEFLQEKYEKKRWYVPPEQAKVITSVQASVSGSSASSTSSTPEVLPQPLKTLHLSKAPSSQSPGISRAHTQPAVQDKKFDLLSDLGGDIFAAPPSHPAATSNFANFAHFNRAPGGVSVPPLPTMAPPAPQANMAGEDRYAALAELDSALSTASHKASQGVFDASPRSAAAPTQPVLPSMQQGFPGAPSTNPFVTSGMAPEPMPTNPFQTNGRASASGSMSMPAGFGNATSYCLPTSFSGTFQQPFPGQGPFHPLPPGAYHQQPNGGFPAYGQAKPPASYGQPIVGTALSNNPFMGGAPTGPYPSGGSSTNPFL